MHRFVRGLDFVLNCCEEFLLAREREFEIEAAAGFCAHLVLLISQVLYIPLRFSIEYYGTPLVKIYDYNQQKTE